MCATLWWTWVVSRALVHYTETGRIIGCLIDTVQTLPVARTDSNGTITSYVHISLAVYPRSNDHLQMHNLIHGNMLSLSSKKQRNGKVSLKNGILGVDYKITINMLMGYLYIAI